MRSREAAREAARRYYLKHKKEKIAYNVRWFRETRRKIAEIWRDGLTGEWLQKHCNEIGKKAEEIAIRILEKEGFADILHLSKGRLPFDFLVKKDNTVYAVYVTTSHYKHRSQSKVDSDKIVDWAGWKRLCLFINPTFKWYVIKELKGSQLFLSHRDLKNKKNIPRL